ncbi:hypothetical protein EVAR_62725_1 [Eumeta japonica]|uniref:Uncharacterized protein n=1 Tax=Eumeta variegata TaxID=151549 RepID=A0A4C1ZGU3_EUMVA|nr:hypothetical protein EVAR_62725_1 [Eumeta japonica]
MSEAQPKKVLSKMYRETTLPSGKRQQNILRNEITAYGKMNKEEFLGYRSPGLTFGARPSNEAERSSLYESNELYEVTFYFATLESRYRWDDTQRPL